MLNPVAMSIIRNVFEDPRERAQAIGVWGALFGISMALGPVLGGVLVDSVGWRSVFIVNVPVGIAAIVLTALFVPESRAPHAAARGPGGPGAGHRRRWPRSPTRSSRAPRRAGSRRRRSCLFAVSLSAFAGRWSPTSCAAASRCSRCASSAARPFSGATATAVALFMAIGGFLFLNTLYLQDVRGLSPLEAGLYTLPMAGVMMVVSPLCGRVVGAFGTALAAGRRRPRGPDQRAHPHPADGATRLRRARRRLRALRRGHRADQPADHQHRDLRDAAVAGRRRGRGGLHRPPGRLDARRRRAGVARRRRAGRRRSGLRRGHPRELVDRGRPGRPRPWCSALSPPPPGRSGPPDGSPTSSAAPTRLARPAARRHATPLASSRGSAPTRPLAWQPPWSSSPTAPTSSCAPTATGADRRPLVSL